MRKTHKTENDCYVTPKPPYNHRSPWSSYSRSFSLSLTISNQPTDQLKTTNPPNHRTRARMTTPLVANRAYNTFCSHPQCCRPAVAHSGTVRAPSESSTKKSRPLRVKRLAIGTDRATRDRFNIKLTLIKLRTKRRQSVLVHPKYICIWMYLYMNVLKYILQYTHKHQNKPTATTMTRKVAHYCCPYSSSSGHQAKCRIRSI